MAAGATAIAATATDGDRQETELPASATAVESDSIGTAASTSERSDDSRQSSPGPEHAEHPLDCFEHDGFLPLIEGEQFPDQHTAGAASSEAAVARQRPGAEISAMRPYGHHPQAPIWVEAGDETFSVTPLPDGGWYAIPATFLGCKTWDELAHEGR